MAVTNSARNKEEFNIILKSLEEHRGLKGLGLGIVMGSWAIRISDLLAISTRRIDKAITEGQIKVIEGKTGKLKVIVLSVKVVEILTKIRTAYPYDKYLFESRRKANRKPISRVTAWRWLKVAQVALISYRRKLGIRLVPNLGTHSLRKTGARLRSQGGAGMTEIQKILNHSRQETSVIYLDISSEDIAETYLMGDETLFV